MTSLNKVLLIGNLGRDPEVRSTSSGAKVANFPIATTESYKDRNGQRQERTEWHRIVMWRGLADIAEKFLCKGSQIFIEGKLQTRSWDDKSGQKRFTIEIVADNLVLLGGRRDSGQTGGDFGGQSSYGHSGGGGYPDATQGGMSAGGSTPPLAPEDDLPF